MGILDDAIREHLDLKRRRGADPDEVQRAEREALGPVRRAREDTSASDPEAEDAAGAFAYDQAAPEGWQPAEATDDWPPEGHDGSTADAVPSSAVAESLPSPGLAADHTESPEPRPPFNPADETEPAAVDDFEAADEVTDSPRPRPSRGRFGFRSRRPAPEEPSPGPAARPLGGVAGGETVEYDVEHALSSPAQPDEDVLEETPEFLQDTPDHDRLWFEQRPPRDFDFDG